LSKKKLYGPRSEKDTRIIEPKNISPFTSQILICLLYLLFSLQKHLHFTKEMELFSLVKIGLKEYKSKTLKLRGQKLQVQFW
jgi:hypothetical protein